jgi:hypothetical protein
MKIATLAIFLTGLLVAPAGRADAPAADAPAPAPVTALEPAPAPVPAPAAEVPAPAKSPALKPSTPDVVLHVPKAEVDKLSIDVEHLETRLDLDTRVASLVQVNAGVVATIGKLKMEMEKVSAETHLVIRLARVTEVIDRALSAVDKHPELARGAAATARTEPLPAAPSAVALAPLPPSGAAGAAASAPAHPLTP